MTPPTATAELRANWRSSWLSSIQELANLEMQRATWLNPYNGNPHYSFVEYIEAYFDGLALGNVDGGYAARVAEGLLSDEEAAAAAKLHAILDRYESPTDDYAHKMSFENAWAKYHAGERPVGWMLREDGAKNWLRFHSLPASKRYADTDDERSVLLARHNALAEEVLGADPCWLVQTHWTTHADEIDAADQYDPFRATRELGLGLVSTFLVDDDEEDRPWRVYAVQTNWSPGRFDDLLLAVADEKAGPTLWMAANGAIFAPYDGGVDLFLPDVAQVQRMSERHKDWLSQHPLGL